MQNAPKYVATDKGGAKLVDAVTAKAMVETGLWTAKHPEVADFSGACRKMRRSAAAKAKRDRMMVVRSR